MKYMQDETLQKTASIDGGVERSSADWKMVCKYIIVPAAVVVLFLKVIFSVYFIPSSSMEPTIPKGSLQLGWRLSYLISSPQPARGDIVVFQHGTDTRVLVKRVIGVGGDQLTISNGVLYLNGTASCEPYLAEGTYTDGDLTFTVPDGKLLLLGDNREDSLDARYWPDPYVDVKNVKAKILFH